MDLVGPRTAVIDQAEFGLGLAQQKSMLLAAGAGRAVPQDLRAGTQHRPMEMRRAGIAFITWQHVCALCLCLFSMYIDITTDAYAHS